MFAKEDTKIACKSKSCTENNALPQLEGMVKNTTQKTSPSENFSTVRLLIEVNGEQIETKYPTECFYINDFAKRMVISGSHIPGRKEKNSVKDFVARNFTKNSDEIAIKYIKEARRGDKAIWTNPAPEKQ